MATVRCIADILVAARGQDPPLPISERWVLRFIKAQLEL